MEKAEPKYTRKATNASEDRPTQRHISSDILRKSQLNFDSNSISRQLNEPQSGSLVFRSKAMNRFAIFSPQIDETNDYEFSDSQE